MNEKYFIVGRKDIDEKKRSLSLTSTESDGGEQHFEDPNTHEKWIEYRIEPEYHGGGYPMLVKQPEPTTSELVKIAMDSDNLEEVAGASVFLYTNEKYDKVDFREELMNGIEDYFQRKQVDLTEFEKRKMNTIIYESNLYDSTNRRNTLGKHFSEVEKDYQYFKRISERAKRILDQTKNGATTNKRS